jgi:hypothetical protein
MTIPPQVPIIPGPGEPYELGQIPPPPRRKPHWWRDLGSGGQAAVVVTAVLAPIFVVTMLVGALTSAGTPEPSANSQAPAASTPTMTTPAAPTPSASPTATPAPPVKASPTPKPPPHAKLSERQWKLVAKDPDKYAGKRYIVHGVVTQFDSATGTDAFRADVGGVRRKPSYGFVDYETNTVFTADASKLAKVVQDDLFTAKVTVVGSYSYDTQIGGSTTVPMLRIDSITVTGSID